MRRTLCIIPVLFALMGAGTGAQETPNLGDVWAETGFDRIAVQSGGMQRTLATYSRDELSRIALSKQIRDDSRITLALLIAMHPGSLADRWIIPVEGDEIIPMLEEQGVQVDNRVIRVGDALVFDPATGQIVSQGPAMQVARHAALTAEEGSLLYAAGVRLFTRINTLAEAVDNLRIIPDPHDPQGAWRTVHEAVNEGLAGAAEIDEDWHALQSAILADNVPAATAAATSLRQRLTELPNYTSAHRLAIDHAYTTKRPYFWASFAYVVSGVFFFISLVTDKRRWWMAAMLLMGGGLVIHCLGAVARGYLIGRMPLSNLYEATTTGLIFVILFALIFEGMYRMKIVGMTSAFLAFIYYRWLVSSQTYGSDTIEPLRAVLNSYWLDYHVTCMMLSYGAFTISFAMAVLYLLRLQFPRAMKWTPDAKALDLYNHRAIQFGWPLLGIGIVLGALWADTAWGRMWSWDPKETWSLITWLIYTGYLHVRLVHGWSGRVMAWASVLGYAAVLFTYLGVNFVLSGLHSYAGGSGSVSGEGFFQRHWLLTSVVVLALMVGVILALVRRGRGPRAGAGGQAAPRTNP